MAKGQWKATGQPMLFDRNGILQDAQHRLFAELISGVTIKSFIVTDIDPIPNLFAFIDNSRPRSAATALQTMGMNGVSSTIAKVIKIGEEVRAGVYNPTGASRLQRLAPADYIDLVNKYPNATKASRSASSDWENVVATLGDRKEIVAYFGMTIIDGFGEAKADDFFDDIMDGPENRGAEDPILALLKLAKQDAAAQKPMKKQYMLAALIKCFNAWHTGTPLGRRWMLQVNEDFPSLVSNSTQAMAAE